MSTVMVCPVIEKTSRSFAKIVSPMATAQTIFSNPDRNFFSIDGSSLELPHVNWGRDFEVRLVLDADDTSTLRRFVRALPKRFEESRSFWGEYVNTLNQSFCSAFGVQYSQIRFSQNSRNQCSLFHADNVTVRLFQTLQGPGTEYLLDDNLNRDGIGRGCNSKIVIDFAKIQQARERDILLMRGDKWFDRRGLVHRSPPIEHLGLKRLYLCLDAIEDPSLPRY